MSQRPRPLLTAGLVAAGIVGGMLAARRARSIRNVAPELRSPLLWAPYSIRGPVSLAAMRLVLWPATRIVPGVECHRVRIPGGQDAYLYLPEGRTGTTGALLWTHGGGTIAGRPEAQHHRCSGYARDLGVPVLAPRYRLAPAHPFPAALDDLGAALRWLRDRAEALDLDPGRIALAGDSAGGLLTASLAQRSLDEGTPVAFQGLVYPMLDDRRAHDDAAGRGAFLWNRASGIRAWRWYLGVDAGGASAPEYAVPSRRTDLAGLPPTWIGVGSLDLFLPEALDYAARLRAAGIEAEEVVVPGMYHAADEGRTETVPLMSEFRRSLLDAVLRAIG